MPKKLGLKYYITGFVTLFLLISIPLTIRLSQEPQLPKQAKENQDPTVLTQDAKKASFNLPDKKPSDMYSQEQKPDCLEKQVLVKFKAGKSKEETERIKNTLKRNVPFEAQPLEFADRQTSAENKIEKLTVDSEQKRDELLGMLKQDPSVEYAELDCKYYATVLPNDPQFSKLWGLHNIGQTGGVTDADIDAPEAWDTTKGSSGVVVAVLDSGIDYNHVDLKANMWVNPFETPGNGKDDDGNCYIDDVYGVNTTIVNSCTSLNQAAGNPMDDNKHGTHVAGTIGAVSNNSIGVTGVAWNVKLMALKFLNSGGSGYTSDAIEAFDYIVAMKQKGINVRVVSNSWGSTTYSQALYDSIKKLRDNGILAVVAAGNSAFDADFYSHYPAAFDLDNIISVAAVDAKNSLAYFSNYGIKTVDLAAPGVEIYSTVPANTYNSFNGTSMATPHVSGVVALLLSKSPFNLWTSTRLKHHLLASVVQNTQLAGKTVTAGVLNANTAVKNSATVEYYPKAIHLLMEKNVQKSVDIVLVNNSSASVSWTTTKKPAFITMNKTGGTVVSALTDTITVSVNSANMSVQTYTDQLQISAGSSAITIPVIVVATDNPFSKYTKSKILKDLTYPRTVSFVDMNNDALQDIHVSGLNGNFLYKNSGNSLFSVGIPLDQAGVYPLTHSWGDYNNDGYTDVLIAGKPYSFGGNSVNLLKNKGNSTFERVTNLGTPIGIDMWGSNWVDYNRDGWIDLFLIGTTKTGSTTTGVKIQVYKNELGNPNGSTNIFTKALDITDSQYQYPQAGTFSDYNNDGYPDLIVGVTGSLKLFQNDKGTFKQITSGVLASRKNNSFGASWADYDNDGDMDIFLGADDTTTHGLFRNDGVNGFSLLTFNQLIPAYVAGGSWGDADNDGDLDLYVNFFSNDINRILLNNGQGGFTRPTDWNSVEDKLTATGVAWGDYNNDGNRDLVTQDVFYGLPGVLYTNNGNGNKGVLVHLHGHGAPNSNKSAIGARVFLTAQLAGKTVTQMREISGQNSPDAQDDLRLHFGLAQTTLIDKLVVNWPSGNRSVLYNYTVPTGKIISIKETPRGDCNGDYKIDATDVTGLSQEISDGDGGDPLNTPKGTFRGFPTCDANLDTVVSTADTSCIQGLILNGPGGCPVSLLPITPTRTPTPTPTRTPTPTPAPVKAIPLPTATPTRTPTPKPLSCTITTTETQIAMTPSSIYNITPSVSSNAYVQKVTFASNNTGIITVGPVEDTTSPYTTRISSSLTQGTTSIVIRGIVNGTALCSKTIPVTVSTNPTF
ncbi:S8 family serine peptidase [Candidatus Roizmanbacteria bacterium]|nr:S8 family serine peptidase [Candidatus Roizmanbacteria bacterium]